MPGFDNRPPSEMEVAQPVADSTKQDDKERMHAGIVGLADVIVTKKERNKRITGSQL